MAKEQPTNAYNDARRYEDGAVAMHLLQSKDVDGARKSLDNLVKKLALPSDDISGLLEGTKASEQGIQAASNIYSSKDNVRRYGLEVSELPDFYAKEFKDMFSNDEYRNLGKSIFQKYSGKTWGQLEQNFEELQNALKKTSKYEDLSQEETRKKVKEITENIQALEPIMRLVDNLYGNRIDSLARPLQREGEIENNDSIAKRFGTPSN
jgi:phenylalanyl-tRNA synthetase alpha subunit